MSSVSGAAAGQMLQCVASGSLRHPATPPVTPVVATSALTGRQSGAQAAAAAAQLLQQQQQQQEHRQETETHDKDLLQAAEQQQQELGLTDAEFQDFTRDVAARIIQAYWRGWRDWKHQVRWSDVAANTYKCIPVQS